MGPFFGLSCVDEGKGGGEGIPGYESRKTYHGVLS